MKQESKEAGKWGSMEVRKQGRNRGTGEAAKRGSRKALLSVYLSNMHYTDVLIYTF